MNTRTGANAAVRRARPNDAEEVAAVVCASIADLCIADHGGDPEIVARWLANKTPSNFRAWIEAPGRVVVAEEHGRIVAVGAALASGRITLNYVLAGCAVSWREQGSVEHPGGVSPNRGMRVQFACQYPHRTSVLSSRRIRRCR